MSLTTKMMKWPVLLLSVGMMLSAQADDSVQVVPVESGETQVMRIKGVSDAPSAIYHDYCSVCHGDAGRGAVWTQGGLDPAPVDFTLESTAKRLRSRDRMIAAVTYGRPQTAMAGWGNRLTEKNIADVVDYVRDNFMPLAAVEAEILAELQGEHNLEHDHDAHALAGLGLPFPDGLVGDATRGEPLYQAACAECHGALGNGKGPRAYFIFPKPRDFHSPAAVANYSRAHLYTAIAEGMVGSEMPAWDKVLQPQDIADISEYVFLEFIVPDSGYTLAEIEQMAMADHHDGHDHGDGADMQMSEEHDHATEVQTEADHDHSTHDH